MLDDERGIVKKEIECEEIINSTKHGLIKKNEGFYADLTLPENQNCWLIGYGVAKYHNLDFCLAYMVLKSENEFKKINHPNDLHYHSSSVEWYFTFDGLQELLVGKEKIKVPKDFLLKIEPNTPHNLVNRKYPFEGITLRTPNIIGDKVSLEGQAY